jgi:hypothetical protein
LSRPLASRAVRLLPCRRPPVAKSPSPLSSFSGMALWIAIGVAAGSALGTAVFDSIGIGIAFGIATGVAVGSFCRTRNG